jgi:hypothetical protein
MAKDDSLSVKFLTLGGKMIMCIFPIKGKRSIY